MTAPPASPAQIGPDRLAPDKLAPDRLTPARTNGDPTTGAGNDRLAIAILLIGAMTIAFSPIFARLAGAIGDIGPVAAAFWRVTLAFPVLLAASRIGPPPAGDAPHSWWLLAAAGFFFAGDLVFWHWSIALTSVANSTLLPNTAPIFVTIGAWTLFGQRPTLTFVVGLALAMTGVVTLMGGSFTVSLDQLRGDLFGVVTALFYAGYILSIARLRAHLPAALVMAWAAAVTALLILPVALLAGDRMLPAVATGWLPLIALGAICHAGGQGSIAWALAHLPPAFSSVTLMVQPVTAAFLGWLIFAEAIGLAQAIAAALVVTGVFVARRGSR